MYKKVIFKMNCAHLTHGHLQLRVELHFWWDQVFLKANLTWLTCLFGMLHLVIWILAAYRDKYSQKHNYRMVVEVNITMYVAQVI